MGEGIDCIFTMCGDTLMNGKEYKKVYCQFEEYYGDKERHYYCAVREEKQVAGIDLNSCQANWCIMFANIQKTVTWIKSTIPLIG